MLNHHKTNHFYMDKFNGHFVMALPFKNGKAKKPTANKTSG
jgi:hypothetical protein